MGPQAQGFLPAGVPHPVREAGREHRDARAEAAGGAQL